MPGQGPDEAVVVRAAAEPLLLRDTQLREAGLRGVQQPATGQGKRQGEGECLHVARTHTHTQHQSQDLGKKKKQFKHFSFLKRN